MARREVPVPLEREPCYVALKPGCGCAIACVVPRLASLTRLSRQVARWMQRGYEIQRVRVIEARGMLERCPHGSPRAKQVDAFVGSSRS